MLLPDDIQFEDYAPHFEVHWGAEARDVLARMLRVSAPAPLRLLFIDLAPVVCLMFSALMYLLARLGALERFGDHLRAPRAELDRHFDGRYGALTVQVPSYAEKSDIVRQTLWSAALQEHPSIRFVLLIDDPAAPTDPEVQAELDATRELADTVQHGTRGAEAALAALRGGRRDFVDRGSTRIWPEDVEFLANEYDWESSSLERMAAAERTVDHVDQFFVDQGLRGLSEDFWGTTAVLRAVRARCRIYD